MFSSSWRDRGFSKSLAVVFETFLYQERFLWGNANIAKHHEIAFSSPKQQRASHNAVSFSVSQEGPGGLWDSVKKAGFVIGSGILFLAAFGNSLTWYVTFAKQQFALTLTGGVALPGCYVMHSRKRQALHDKELDPTDENWMGGVRAGWCRARTG